MAIVGRPNVGKSTFFNRLVGERRSIVSDIPGTTRDRVSATVSWAESDFWLVDTGGLEVITTSSDIWGEVKVQAEIAIQEADLIIFMVTVADGLTFEDADIAQTLRETRKPLLLVVNKVDNPKREQEAVEFNQLGLGEPHYISAYHNLGINPLMETLVDHLPDDDDEEEEDVSNTRLAIVGRTNVGKSHLLNAILGYQRSIVSDVPGTTRDAIDIPISFEGKSVTLIDTAGVRRRGRVEGGIEKYSVLRTIRAIERSNVCLLVVDASEGITAQDTHIAGEILESYRGVVVVVNKWDLVQDDLNKRDMANDIRRKLKFIPYAPIVFTSALMGSGIKDVLGRFFTVHKEGNKFVPQHILWRTLMSALASHPPTGRKGRPIKIYGVSQEKVNPLTFVFPVNDPALIHFSYRRYIENRIRSRFGFIGNPLHLVFSAREKRGK